jgi:hypothetical protein
MPLLGRNRRQMKAQFDEEYYHLWEETIEALHRASLSVWNYAKI